MKLLTYAEVLERLSREQPDQCHLLLGNGFNNSLGVQTSYEEIFKRMVEEVPTYRKIESLLEGKEHNIEWLIKESKNIINSTEENSTSSFLEAYIEKKIKLDFMIATSKIARDRISNIYKEKNAGIHLLFKHFLNYFTLNYDTLLYLLLMKFKRKAVQGLGDGGFVIFNTTELFQKEDIDRQQSNIYTKIQKILKEGVKTIVDNEGELMEINLNVETKGNFEADIKQVAKSNGESWTDEDIKKVTDKIWEEKKREKYLEINDGFFGELFMPYVEKQNIFFLHGSFHIYENKKEIYKVTQKQNKPLYSRLANIIDSEDQDILCVLTGTSEDKKEQIEENAYLTQAHKKLSSLQGNIMILGSSLAKNDAHIFDAINSSGLSNIYISSSNEDQEKDSQRASILFPNKNVALFDHNTISYASDSNEE